MLYLTHDKPHRTPWNKGKLTGQKPPLKLNEVWAIRIRLQLSNKTRDLALWHTPFLLMPTRPMSLAP